MIFSEFIYPSRIRTGTGTGKVLENKISARAHEKCCGSISSGSATLSYTATFFKAEFQTNKIQDPQHYL
jgi:hypothetical protein